MRFAIQTDTGVVSCHLESLLSPFWRGSKLCVSPTRTRELCQCTEHRAKRDSVSKSL